MCTIYKLLRGDMHNTDVNSNIVAHISNTSHDTISDTSHDTISDTSHDTISDTSHANEAQIHAQIQTIIFKLKNVKTKLQKAHQVKDDHKKAIHVALSKFQRRIDTEKHGCNMIMHK